MIHRIDVRPRGDDPAGESVAQQIRDFGIEVGRVSTARIFLIDSDAPQDQIQRAAQELLADPIVETARFIPHPHGFARGTDSRIEVHLKPGVMDPVAASTEMALRDMGIDVREVRTGRVYFIGGANDRDVLEQIARKVLANGVIESVHFEALFPSEFEAADARPFEVRRVTLLKLCEDELKRLSREGHLFLSLPEMQAIQTYFREQGREPTDIELETIAQTWSEHCVHKTLKSAVDVFDENGKPLRHYDSLIRDTIFGSTKALISGTGLQPVLGAQHGLQTRATKEGFCLSVFKDNAGVIAFDETDAVCFKVETHNHPSAIEPYGGAATGIGGCIRDVMGTGLSAKPIANTDVFCVAYPDATSSIANRKSQIANLPRGVIHPKRILHQVVAGVRDYGNRMGIPTVNGAVYFDNRYIGNPLVFAGCVGIIPRNKIHKEARAGDAIVVMGGRTGRDGIHGATFSSAELTDTHADEFSHAVQIGNAITQKKMLDVILHARDRNLFTSITDCGAGGLSSAVGEMGEKLGAAVELGKVPLKYAGLRYDEIWISEAQERMVLSVPPELVDELLNLATSEDVEATMIGTFGTENRELLLHFRGEQVGRLSMEFLHNGLPMPRRRAVAITRGTGFQPVQGATACCTPPDSASNRHGLKTRATVKDHLLLLLAHPNIASKHWIIRQYDHEVQGGSVIKPLTGPLQIGPSDAAVVRPKLDSYKGVAIACGLAPHIEDPYDMAVASIDEAIRNAVCVGSDPDKLAILDNFCWPSCDDEESMGALVRACEACRDAALAYGIPFISGKDSLNNQFTDTETGKVIRIPRTLLISAIGVMDDVRKCVTMDLKDTREGHLLLVRGKDFASLENLAATHRAVAGVIRNGHILSCHDVSDGGWLVAAAEMCIASGFGVEITADAADAFHERNGAYLLEVHGQRIDAVSSSLGAAGIEAQLLGRVRSAPAALELGVNTANRTRKVECHIFVEELTRAWRGTLDW
jgi:phosphoribosylformylglycinamidine synthase